MEEAANPLASLPVLYEMDSELISKLCPETKGLASENVQKDGTKQGEEVFHFFSL